MSGVRNYTSTAAQSSHASVARSANARRSAQRMAMRLAWLGSDEIATYDAQLAGAARAAGLSVLAPGP